MHRFFHYDRTTGEEAQRSLNDLLRLEAKDAESSQRERDKNKKELALDKEKKSCFSWNGVDGCKRGGDCGFLHSCSNCGKGGHGLAKCPKVKAS